MCAEPLNPEDPPAPEQPGAATGGESEPGPEPEPQAGFPTSDERLYGMLCHLLGLAGLTGIPGANVIGPLVIWLSKRETSTFVDDQGKEALNFQISLAIVVWALFILSVPLMMVFIGFLLWPLGILIGIGGMVFSVLAALEANKGVLYRYPITFRFLH